MRFTHSVFYVENSTATTITPQSRGNFIRSSLGHSGAQCCCLNAQSKIRARCFSTLGPSHTHVLLPSEHSNRDLWNLSLPIMERERARELNILCFCGWREATLVHARSCCCSWSMQASAVAPQLWRRIRYPYLCVCCLRLWDTKCTIINL